MAVASYKQWNPQTYLDHYYTTKKIAEDEIHIYKFILKFLKEHSGFTEMLDFGAGPTIHHLIPFAEHVKEIHVADYVPANLREIKKWVQGHSRAHNWLPYIEGSLKIEGKPVTRSAIASRTKSLRKSIKGFLKGDLFKSRPILIKKEFSLVASFYCAECATTSKKKWEKGIKNLSHLIKPGGWFIMSALEKSKSYKSGDLSFPSTHIGVTDVQNALRKAGFDMTTSEVHSYPIKQWEGEGFSGIIICKSQKPL